MKEQIKNFIIPSIDLLDGKIVRLFQGDYNKKTEYNVNLDELLGKYKQFSQIHVVDLNCARRERNDVNCNIIKTIIKKFNGSVQIGGGVRNASDIENKLNLGFSAVVIGTMALKNADLTKQMLYAYGKDKIVLSFDCECNKNSTNKEDLRNYYVKINGWQDSSKVSVFDVLKEYYGLGKTILITDISVDGTMKGPNVALYRQIKRTFPKYVLQASGGVSSIEDVKKVINVADNVIVGKALYNGLLNIF